jgi:hypothetical protein
VQSIREVLRNHLTEKDADKYNDELIDASRYLDTVIAEAHESLQASNQPENQETLRDEIDAAIKRAHGNIDPGIITEVAERVFPIYREMYGIPEEQLPLSSEPEVEAPPILPEEEVAAPENESIFREVDKLVSQNIFAFYDHLPSLNAYLADLEVNGTEEEKEEIRLQKLELLAEPIINSETLAKKMVLVAPEALERSDWAEVQEQAWEIASTLFLLEEWEKQADMTGIPEHDDVTPVRHKGQARYLIQNGPTVEQRQTAVREKRQALLENRMEDVSPPAKFTWLEAYVAKHPNDLAVDIRKQYLTEMLPVVTSKLGLLQHGFFEGEADPLQDTPLNPDMPVLEWKHRKPEDEKTKTKPKPRFPAIRQIAESVTGRRLTTSEPEEDEYVTTPLNWRTLPENPWVLSAYLDSPDHAKVAETFVSEAALALAVAAYSTEQYRNTTEAQARMLDQQTNDTRQFLNRAGIPANCHDVEIMQRVAEWEKQVNEQVLMLLQTDNEARKYRPLETWNDNIPRYQVAKYLDREGNPHIVKSAQDLPDNLKGCSVFVIDYNHPEVQKRMQAIREQLLQSAQESGLPLDMYVTEFLDTVIDNFDETLYDSQSNQDQELANKCWELRSLLFSLPDNVNFIVDSQERVQSIKNYAGLSQLVVLDSLIVARRHWGLLSAPQKAQVEELENIWMDNIKPKLLASGDQTVVDQTNTQLSIYESLRKGEVVTEHLSREQSRVVDRIIRDQVNQADQTPIIRAEVVLLTEVLNSDSGLYLLAREKGGSRARTAILQTAEELVDGSNDLFDFFDDKINKEIDVVFARLQQEIAEPKIADFKAKQAAISARWTEYQQTLDQMSTISNTPSLLDRVRRRKTTTPIPPPPNIPKPFTAKQMEKRIARINRRAGAAAEQQKNQVWNEDVANPRSAEFISPIGDLHTNDRLAVANNLPANRLQEEIGEDDLLPLPVIENVVRNILQASLVA